MFNLCKDGRQITDKNHWSQIISYYLYLFIAKIQAHIFFLTNTKPKSSWPVFSSISSLIREISTEMSKEMPDIVQILFSPHHCKPLLFSWWILPGCVTEQDEPFLLYLTVFVAPQSPPPHVVLCFWVMGCIPVSSRSSPYLPILCFWVKSFVGLHKIAHLELIELRHFLTYFSKQLKVLV